MSQIKDHKIDQLTVPEIKKELERRNLPTQGAKAALIARLREAVKLEEYDIEAVADSDLDMGAEGGDTDEKLEGSTNALMQMLLTIENSMEKQSSEINKTWINNQRNSTNNQPN